MTVDRKIRVTLKDVANEAGVAIMTASKVFNKHPRVRGHLRERVLASAEKLNYHPNNHAQALRRSSSDIISLAMVSLDNPFFGLLAEKLSTSLRKDGYQPVLCNSFESVSEVGNVLCPAATIMVSPGSAERVKNLTGAIDRIFTLLALEPDSEASPPNIGLDFSAAYPELVEAALAEGRTNFHYHCSSVDYKRLAVNAKCSAIRKALKEKNRELEIPDAKAIQSNSDFAEYLLRDNDQSSAVFCENDLLALCLFRELKIRAPKTAEKIRIIGCDGIIPVGENFWTVKIDIDQIVENTLKIMKEIVNNDVRINNIKLKTRAIIQ